MRLVSNWRKVLRHSWSIRLLAIAAILTWGEVFLSLWGGGSFFDPKVFAILLGIVSSAAFVARLIAQKEFLDADKQDSRDG